MGSLRVLLLFFLFSFLPYLNQVNAEDTLLTRTARLLEITPEHLEYRIDKEEFLSKKEASKKGHELGIEFKKRYVAFQKMKKEAQNSEKEPFELKNLRRKLLYTLQDVYVLSQKTHAFWNNEKIDQVILFGPIIATLLTTFTAYQVIGPEFITPDIFKNMFFIGVGQGAVGWAVRKLTQHYHDPFFSLDNPLLGSFRKELATKSPEIPEWEPFRSFTSPVADYCEILLH